ncbi:hypothetical protein [Rhizobium leucaenae]|nr:hypothetical protein [Rhizobium leucaenae]
MRGVERATAHAGSTEREHRLVPTQVNGRSEMLPDNPKEVARILKERRAKKSPAAKAKERMAAAMKKRGI